MSDYMNVKLLAAIALMGMLAFAGIMMMEDSEDADAASSVTITVRSAGNGTVSGGGTFYLGDIVTLTATPSNGYMFDSWTFTGGSSTANPLSYEIRQEMLGTSVTYTANFVSNSATIVVRSGGNGTVSGGGTYQLGDTVTISATPSSGYSFINWTFTGGSSNVNPLSYEIRQEMIGQSVTYTANFGKNVTVSFNANGGSVGTASKTVTVGSTYGTLPVPSKSGYGFLGWYTASSGGSKVTASTSVTNTSNHTLYAHWQQETQFFNVTAYATYNTNATMYLAGAKVTTSASTSITSGDRVSFSYTNLDSGYSATWMLVTDSTGDVQYTTGSSKRMAFYEPTSIYLITEPMPMTITVTSAGNGTVTGGGTYNLGDQVSLRATPNTGYVFSQWTFTGGSSVVNPYEFEVQQVMLGQSVTYTANFTAAQYTVTFNASSNGGSTPTATKNVTYNSTYGTLPTATKTGHVFNGWFTAASGGTQVTSSTTVTITAPQTLYAQFTPATYTVTFDATTNGGTLSGSSSKTVTYGSTYGTLPTATKTNNEFLGWYTASSGGTKITSSSTVSITVNQTLYAQFTAKTFTVTFNASTNGGSTPTGSKTVTYGSTYGTLPTATKTNNEFLGWYTASSGGTRITSSTTVTITANQTLYAQFTVNVVTITATSAGNGTVSGGGSYHLGDTVTLTATPNSGYVFDKWTFSGGTSLANPLTYTVQQPMIGQSVSYTASFKAVYTVTISAGANGTVSPQSVSVVTGTTYSANGNTLTFSDGQTVVATPNTNFATSWGSSSGTITSNKTISVSFNSTVVTITATSAGNGTVSGSGTYSLGDTVTLTATPNNGYVFDKWTFSGGTSLANPLTYTVQQSMIGQSVTYTANFKALYTVTISAGANGTVSPQSVSVPTGTTYTTNGNTLSFSNGTTVTATPNTNFATSWSPSSGTVTSNSTISVSFNSTVATITVTSAGHGTVSGSGTYSLGDTVTMTATPDNGYGFDKWTFSGGTSLANPLSYVIQQPMIGQSVTYTANFKELFTVTITAGSNGTVNKASVSVADGTTFTANGNVLTFSDGQTVIATPSTDYATTWSPSSGTVSAATTISATFGSTVTSITALSAGHGSVTGGGTFHLGDTVSLVATPDYGYKFSQWTFSGGSSLVNPYTFEVQQVMLGQSVTYTANFEINAVTITAVSAGHGTASGSGIYELGDTVTLTATPDNGYVFGQWTFSNGSSLANPLTYTVQQPMIGQTVNYTANFKELFTVTISAGANGTVDKQSVQVADGTTFTANGNVLTFSDGQTVTATPSTDYATSWSPSSGTVTAAMTISASFDSTVLSVTVLSAGNGSVSGGGTFHLGDTVTLTATPDHGYKFSQWTFSGGSSLVNPYTFEVQQVMLGQSVTYTANFEINSVTVNVVAGPNGSVTGGGVYELGETVVLTAIPDHLYRFTQWTFTGGTSITNPLSYEVRSEMIGQTVTYTANFDINYTTITVTSAGNGTATGSGMYEVGETVVLTAVADQDYIFSRWTFADSSSLANPLSFEVRSEMVGQSATYTANFVLNAVTINVVAGPNGTATGGGVYSLGDEVTLEAVADSGYRFDRWVFEGGSSLANPLSFEVREMMLGQTVTYTATFTDNYSVWWNNDYVNGSVNIAFWYQTNSDYVHGMQIPLVKYDGIEDNGDGIKFFSDSGYSLTFTVPYNGALQCTLKHNGEVVASNIYQTGTWLQFALGIDAQSGKVTFNGTRSLGWNAGQTFTFTNYETVFSTVIFDFSSIVNDLAIWNIYHADLNGVGDDHPRFQVTATTTYLDTHGYVMNDPSIDIHALFPEYDNIRLNLYSFAVYGDTMTVNGHTFTLDGSKIMDLYYTNEREALHDDPYDPNKITGWREFKRIADQSTEGAVLWQPTLNNIYVTWTNISSLNADDRQCYLTFVDDNVTIEMGSFDSTVLSFTGIWYFTTAVWEPYNSTETVYTMDPNDWFNLSSDAFILTVIGLLVILTVIFNVIWRPSLLDYAIIVGGGIIAYVLVGGL